MQWWDQAKALGNDLMRDVKGGAAIRIAMVGPSRIGKTSLMASMFYVLRDIVGSVSSLQLYADDDTMRRLKNKHNALESLFDDPTTLEITGALPGDEVESDYHFRIAREGNSEGVQLTVTDWPGGWLSSKSPKRATMLAILRGSDIIIAPVDTPALVEARQDCDHGVSSDDRIRKGCWHCQYNQPDSVTSAVSQGLVDVGRFSEAMVIFVPLRCEKYVGSNDVDLVSAVQRGYPRFFGPDQPGSRENVCVVIGPAQTLGTVHYAGQRWRLGNDYLPKFRKTTKDATRHPVDVEQPLLYALRFLLVRYQQIRQRSNAPVLLARMRLSWLVRRISNDAALESLMTDLSSRVQQHHGYAVTNGRHLLKMPSER